MDIDVKGHMLFDSGMNYGIKDWWIGTIVLMVINMAITMVAGMAGVAIIGTIGMVLVMWASLGLWVGRLRNRGHTDIVAFVLRIIIMPWGLIECAFMGSAE
ncbi:MAG TPA: hypothetical protein EYN58_02515 [Candidatus Poseidoniales archaeon]|nr:MAG: hypothetical protein CXX81_24875 [Euryarchaeota archaeon]HHZ74051.1 hypothetical protein [Candidatus Poseidoniales archaeon]PXY76210.1 MAG: hypothetical protein CXX81_16040 [Euryarchaeota archaeon]PXY78228.1 MAG: hypothetical protein CXX81_08910 [Euryarchaeota archaeon]HIA25657.1 hypothetical protein [Candidatus Poseidoniales archaeon]